MPTRAAFIPAYCLYLDGSRLTWMSEQAVFEAIRLFKTGEVSHLIISAAYGTWHKEAQLKRQIIIASGVSASAVNIIAEVTDSYDEARKVRAVAYNLALSELVVVADKWHLPRALEAFRANLPGISVRGHAFETPRYEMTLEPSRIKSIRAGFAPLWIAWNLLFQLLTPLFLRKTS